MEAPIPENAALAEPTNLVSAMAAKDDKKKDSLLLPQTLEGLDPGKLHPLSPEVISRQATINIGTIGHVAHGKSTVVKAISGVQTVRFKNELERNITIKLGYANAKIYKCDSATCARPGCFRAYGSAKEDSPACERPGCTGRMQLQRHVSFVDCFGPEVVFVTPTGTIANKDIVVGTKLLGPDGKERTVGTVEDGRKKMYEIEYVSTRAKNGIESEKFTCSGGHLLCLRIDTPVDAVVCDNNKKANKYFVKQYQGDADGISSFKVSFATRALADAYYAAADKSPVFFTMTVEAYLAAPATVRTKARMYLAKPMEFDGAKFDLAVGTASAEEVAWLVCLWLGDGNAAGTRFTLSASKDMEIKARIATVATKMGLTAIVKQYANRDAVWVNLSTASGPARADMDNLLAENGFFKLLKALGLINNKHMPPALLFHTTAVRAAVVAGLLDADGSYSGGQFDLEQSEVAHYDLFHGFVRLVRSLGFVAHVSRHVAVMNGAKHNKLRVRFNGPADLLPVATVSKCGAPLARAWAMSVPFTIKPVGIAPFRKWAVDGDGQVLLETFVVAHNCPGHDILMATMLNGAAVMDASLLLIAGNEPCPQPQTSEHLAAIEIMRLQHIIILQNKIDLVKEAAAAEQYKQILKFVQGTVAEGAPIIPISAQLKYNIDVICETICKRIPIPKRNFVASPRLIVIRSVDVNKPGAEVDELRGGVAGGSILQGVLKVGDEIEVRPGIVSKDPDGALRCVPIFSRIVSLFAEENDLKYAVPGGLIGVGTKIDPTLCRADRLVGQVLGEVGKLPDIFTELEINFFLLRRLLGVKSEGDKQNRVQKLVKGEVLMVNIGSTSTGGRVVAVKQDLAKISLISPVCTLAGEKIALSRRVEKHWRLIGWGQIIRGNTIQVAATAP